MAANTMNQATDHQVAALEVDGENACASECHAVVGQELSSAVDVVEEGGDEDENATQAPDHDADADDVPEVHEPGHDTDQDPDADEADDEREIPVETGDCSMGADVEDEQLLSVAASVRLHLMSEHDLTAVLGLPEEEALLLHRREHADPAATHDLGEHRFRPGRALAGLYERLHTEAGLPLAPQRSGV